MDAKIEKFVRLAKSTNAVAADVAKKELAKLGLDESGNPVGGEKPKKEPKAPKEPKPRKEMSAEKKEALKKSGKVSKIDVSEDKQFITYKGRRYSIEECDDLFKAWNMKKKAAVKSAEKSVSKPTTEKVLDKAETTIKQIVSDKNAKKKIQENPKQAKRELIKVQKTMRAWLDAVEEFLGKKIPESKVKKVFALLGEIELMEDGGALSYADVYEGRSAEFRDGGSMSGDTPKIYVADLAAYNNGMLVGEWLDLSDYNDGSEVMDAINELLEKWSEESGEEREEYAIHDYENFDSGLYSEYMGEESFDKVVKSYKLSEEKGVPMSVISYIMREYDPDDVEEWYDEHFEGEFDSDEDLAYNYVEMIGGVSELGKDTLERYFDYESFGRDLAYDYTEIDGFYFRNYKRGGEIKKYDLNKYVKK